METDWNQMDARTIDFERWCNEPLSTQGDNFQTSKLPGGSDFAKRYLVDRKTHTINVDSSSFDIDCTRRECAYIEEIQVIENTTRISIKNLSARQIALHAPCTVSLINCDIGQITVDSMRNVKLTVINCRIGILEIKNRSIYSLSLDDVDIKCIRCPPPGVDDTPFSGGSVTFRKLRLPFSKEHSSIYEGWQSYASMRWHLESLQNSSAAGVMRLAELRAQRRSERWLTWLISVFNYHTSRYGQRPERAAIYLLGVFCLVVGVLAAFGGTATGFKDGIPVYDALAGISSKLAGIKTIAHFRRALILAIQALNPFSLFDSRRMLVPSAQWASTLLFVHGLVSDALIAVIVMAVRRKLKIPT